MLEQTIGGARINREILFRGFHECDNGGAVIKVDGKKKHGKWLYGNLVEDSDGNFIVQEKERRSPWSIEKVIPSTVGQFTGLTDKNGKRVFEGDVVEFDRKIRAQKMLRVRGNVFFEEETCAFSVSNDFIFNSNAGFLCDCENIEATNNIFETDLIGGESNV